MGLASKVTLGYKDIFQDYATVDIKATIADIPTKIGLEVMGYFLAQLHSIQNDAEQQIEFLKKWIERLPQEVKRNVQNVIDDIQKKPDAEFNFLNPISALGFMEILLQNENQKERVDDLTPQQELDLFKGYLWASQQWIDRQENNIIFKGKAITEEDAIQVLLPSQLPYFELAKFKDLRWQFIKAVYFFRFCAQNPQFKVYLDIFLKEYKLKSWNEYLAHIVTMYLPAASRPEKPSLLYIPDEFAGALGFVETLCIDPKTITPSPDFLSLREKPVYRISKNDFLFLNYNFFVDKIFQGIQFDFARILIKNGAEFKGKPIKSFPDFKSVYGAEFSETGLFYAVMDYVFGKSGYIQFKGTEMKATIGDGEPDYYMRDKAKVYLFEFKDVLLDAKTKHSHNYTDIEKEIFKKFVKNQNESPKGVTQIINSLKKLWAGEFNKFDNYSFD